MGERGGGGGSDKKSSEPLIGGYWEVQLGGLYCVRPAETIPCWAAQLAGCQSSMVGSTNKPPCDADGVRQPGDWLHPTEAETRTALYMRNQNHAKGGADKLAEAMSIRLSYSLNDIKPSKHQNTKTPEAENEV